MKECSLFLTIRVRIAAGTGAASCSRSRTRSSAQRVGYRIGRRRGVVVAVVVVFGQIVLIER